MAHISSGDVASTLKQYGVTNPTDAEIAIFTGMDVIGGSANAAIAEYANYKTTEAQREASDPLAAYQTLEQNFATQSQFDEDTPRYIRDAGFPSTGF